MQKRIALNSTRFAHPSLTTADLIVFLGVISFLYVGIRLAFDAPTSITGPEISLSFSALPWYALFSVCRMTAAYVLALAFSLIYGYWAARSQGARVLLMPLLDVLQSVPILSFLPVVLLSLSSFLPQRIAVELSAITLIFTSQAWNLTFSFYQSLITVPNELREAAAVFRFSRWLRFKIVDLPCAAIGLLWNSMMSWSGGWFFLMAAEIFHVGSRDFRLPGLGSYLQTAANNGNMYAVIAGIATLVAVIILLDQGIWQPVAAWTEKFRIEMVESEEPSESWLLNVLRRSWLMERLYRGVVSPLEEWTDRTFILKPGERVDSPEMPAISFSGMTWVFIFMIGCGLMCCAYYSILMLGTLRWYVWIDLSLALLATFLRVHGALIIALAWTIPLGVLIGSNRRLASRIQPFVQVVASIPATALFPVVLMAFLKMPGGLNIAAVGLMLMGTQWYLLFNIIAGTYAIPQDLLDTTELLRLSRLDRWRTLILPALFPYIITGSIAASGGAWNASIVAEYVEFGGRTHSVAGIGATIAEATSRGEYPMLLASTLFLIFAVVLINRTLWARMYRLAEERYRME